MNAAELIQPGTYRIGEALERVTPYVPTLLEPWLTVRTHHRNTDFEQRKHNFVASQRSGKSGGTAAASKAEPFRFERGR